MTDLISRQAALEVLHEVHINRPLDSDRWVIADIRDKIEQLPVISPARQEKKRGEWIPCGLRFPEEDKPVNITYCNHAPASYYANIKDVPFVATGIYHGGHWYWWSCVCGDYLAEYGDFPPDRIDSSIEVIAWMPLPNPYGGEEE